MNASLTVADGPAFLRLMKRYVVNYTNSHDQSITQEIMEPNYRLRMGDHLLNGRDGEYASATRRQFEQFPGLGLTVHEICTSGERLAMRFSEHGASVKHHGRCAAWGGIGLYCWNRTRLTANTVEQDYFSRAEQLSSGNCNPVESPAPAPWDTPAAAEDGDVERVVRGWLEGGHLEHTDSVLFDDGWIGNTSSKLIEQRTIEVNDLFSCGKAVAFHATQSGRLLRPLRGAQPDGRSVRLHLAGIVHVENNSVARGRIIRNRLDLLRSLQATP